MRLVKCYLSERWVSLSSVFLVMFTSFVFAGGNNIRPVDAFTKPDPSLVINLNFTLSNYNGFNISCNGLSDGSVDLTPSAGTAPYTFVWSNGALTEDLNGVSAGTYTVTVTDNLGDTQTGSVTLVEPNPIVVTLDSTTNAGCDAGTGGAVYISLSGGAPGFTFLWSDGSTTEDLLNVVAGNYTVTITDLNLCQKQDIHIVGEDPLIVLSTDITNVNCFGSLTGGIDLVVTDGTPGFSFLWNNGSITEDISGVSSGTYTVTVTDAAGCIVSLSETINQPAALSLSAITTDVKCFAGSTGSINLTVNGGTPGYSFLWSNGFTGEDPTGLTAGTYTVTVTDANLCTSTTSAVVSQPSLLALSASGTNVSCAGGSNGSINLTVSGGTAGFTYNWSNGAIVEDPSGLSAGTYTVTVTDANSCTATTSLVISSPSAINISRSVTNVSCNGGSNGAINITVTGGTVGYSFVWSNSALTEDISSLVAGTYTVTVTDANFCTASLITSISQPSAINLSTSVTNVNCNGASTGAVNLTVSGATPGYTYLWSNGAIVEDPSGLPAGTFTVTVTDANFCTATTNTTIAQPTAYSLSSSVTNVNCNGASTGAINLTVSGATPGYTYLWSNGAIVEDPSGLPTGTYTVTVTDANLCTATTSATIAQSTALNLSTSVTNVNCNAASTGAINLTVSGATPGYTYLWSNGSIVQDPSGLPAGTFTVTVTDANLCTATTSATIAQPTALNLSTTVTNVNCSGTSTGAINLTVSGATPGYTYLWSNGAIVQDPSGLSAGTYTVTVTDANSCSATTSAVVGQSSSISISFVPVNGTCNASNGSVTAIPTGGTPGYTYLWSTGAVLPVITGLAAGTYTVTVTDLIGCSLSQSVSVSNTGSPLASLASPATVLCNGNTNGAIDINVTSGTSPYTYLWSTGAITQDINSLGAGTYTVTITDVNFCVLNTSFTVTQPGIINIAGTVTDVACNAGATGSIDITVTGGTPGYTYLWSNGAIVEDPSGLLAGTITVTVTDANLCTKTGSYTVGQPTALNATASSTQTGCGVSTGSATVIASGGTSGYSYLWSNGGITATINNIPAGIYTVTVTDANLCTKTATTTVSSANAPIISTANVTAATCFGGTDAAIDITVSAGTPSYSYNWSNGSLTQDISGIVAGTYTVTIVDINNCSVSASYVVSQATVVTSAGTVTNVLCNGGATGSINITPSGGNGTYTYLWSTSAVTQDISGLTSGTYTVTITDGNNCTGTSTYTVTQPSNLASSAVITAVLCNGASTGSINLTPAGGTSPYTYLWSNGFTGQDPSGLAAGTYTVTITDNNGCTRVRVSNVTQPSAISGTLSTTSVSCSAVNGTAAITASGGTGALSYLWNTGAITNAISGLSTGTYTVTVTDANACTQVFSGTVTSANSPSISNAVIDSVSCFGGSDGGVNITVTGGTPAYSYLWSNGILTQDISGVVSGVYTVTVTDQNSCTATASYTVHEPLVLQASFTQTPASCGLANGSVQAIISGGTTPYSYLWSTGGVASSIVNKVAGTYSVTITDANGCTGNFSVILGGTQGVVIDSAQIQNVSCNGSNDGAINIFVSGGTAPLTYVWSNSAITEDISGLTNGNYTVTVTDAAGCTARKVYTVTQPAFLSLQLTSTPSFCGQATGTATVTPTGGTSPYTYLWTNGQVTQTITALTSGTYGVTVTDLNGCTRRRNIAVTLANGPVINLVAQVDVTCNGGNNGSLDISVAGGVLPYTYQWSSGSLLQDVSSLSAGVYTVFVTDSALCADSAVFTILEPDSFVVTSSIQSASCGLSNGAISLTVNGATPGYSYAWSGGQITSSISGLSAGSYTVTISDTVACDTTLTFVVPAANGPVAVLDSVRNIRCFGSLNGRIYISVSGGTSPFTYLWNDGNINQDRTGLAAGTYTVTVTDFGGCTSLLAVTLTQNSQISLSFTSQQASCNQSNGSAAVSPSGGVSPYTFLWETGGLTSTITNLSAGIYSVTVTDSVGCVKNDSVSVTNTGSPSVVLQSQVKPACYGGSNGSLTISVSGGTPQYNIVWSNGDAGLTADSLIAGTYAVTVTDALGCSELKSFVLTQPDSLSLQVQSVTANCGQANGSASVLVTGGTGTYSYLWSSGAIVSSVTNLLSGTYAVTVTDQNLCTKSASVAVANQAAPQLSIDLITDVNCFGGTDGAIAVSVTGGLSPIAYNWSSGQQIQDISNLSAGNYLLIVTDSAGCKDTIPATVHQPTDIVIQTNITDASCGNANGSAVVTPSGGTPGYTYLWSTGSNTNTISGVVANTYTVTVTDNHGCTKLQTVPINNINGPTISLVNMTPATCPGDSTGQLSITVLQGTQPFSYLWSNGSISQVLSNVPAGIYTLTVTDANNCVNFFVDTITQPDPIQFSATITDASCGLSNGIITVQASGGTAGYTYLWSSGTAASTLTGVNAGNYTVTVTDAAFCTYDSVFAVVNTGIPTITLVAIDSVTCNGGGDGSIDLDVNGGVGPYQFTWINTSQTTEDVSNLIAGSYSVIVTDQSGCTTTQSYTVGQPLLIQLAFPVLQNAACGQSNGFVVVAASGGVPAYSYLWSNSSVNDTITNLVAGSYTVTVTDSKGCTKSLIANISNLTGPSISSVDSTNIDCNGGNNGFINVTAMGVSQPLSYSWTGLTDTTSSIDTLVAGSYTLTVTDAAGCLVIRTITLTEPQPFTINSFIPQKNPPYNISCFGLSDGEINLSVNGGTAPYSFVWSNGAITQNLLNLPANTYIVFIKDANNCATSDTFTVNQPPQLLANAGTDFIVCGDTVAILNASAPSIGNGFWQVVSTPGAVLFANASSPVSAVSGLGIGDNVLMWTITDGLCSDTDIVSVTVASEIDAIGGIDRKICGSEASLNATRPEFGYGYWTALTPGISLEDSSKAFTAVEGLSYGNNSFLWTVVNGTCRDSVVVNIFRKDTLDCLAKIQLPTAFSPNFDGSNDYLIIKGLDDFPDNEIIIYNRWGQVVFSQNNYRNDWYGLDESGYPVSDGTYFVIVKVRFIDKVYNTYIDIRR